MKIAFVPARCGSKAIPYKNIKIFCGKPLIYWSLKALQGSSNIDFVYVATDCNKIKDVVNSFNFTKVKVYMRDKKNATDTASTESVMLEFIKNNNCLPEDYFILVQATSPLVSSSDFDLAFNQMKIEKSDSLLSCTRFSRFLWSNDGNPLNYDYMKRPRRQEFKGSLMENGALYINKVSNICKYKNRLSGRISIFEMSDYTFIELDEESDWFAAEGLMKKYIIGKT